VTGGVCSAIGSNSSNPRLGAGEEVDAGGGVGVDCSFSTGLPKKSTSCSDSRLRCLVDLDNLGEGANSKASIPNKFDLLGAICCGVGVGTDGVEGSSKPKRSCCGGWNCGADLVGD
jgi:hypothetical protein